MSLVRVPLLQLLESQPFVSIQQVYDAAILEAVLFEDVLLRANTASTDCKMLTKTSIIVSPLK